MGSSRSFWLSLAESCAAGAYEELLKAQESELFNSIPWTAELIGFADCFRRNYGPPSSKRRWHSHSDDESADGGMTVESWGQSFSIRKRMAQHEKFRTGTLMKFHPLWRAMAIAACTLVAHCARGQQPLFTELAQPVRLSGGGGAPFPALRNLKAAWGDFDADGQVDLIICGVGTNGPETHLYRQQREGAFPPFVEIAVPGLPQVQDGALAWGDFDNDGDLDLAMVGAVSGPTDIGRDTIPAANLRGAIYRNNGPDGAGGWLFGNPIGLPPCRYGTVSWADIDNDGDLDLFVSGLGPNDVAFSRIYGSPRRTLNLEGQFLTSAGIARVENGEASGPEDGLFTRHVTWVDNNQDGFLDAVLTTQSLGLGQAFNVHQVWMNTPGQRTALGRFTRAGVGPAGAVGFFPPIPLWTGSDWLGGPPFSLFAFSLGGVGDWDGDGRVDMAYPGGTEQNGGNFRVVLHQYAAALPNDPIPGFKVIQLGEPADQGVAAQVSADFLNDGRDQLIASVFPYADGFVGAPMLRIFGDDGADGLAELPYPLPLGLFDGVLEAADVDEDGYLDFLHSGLDANLVPRARLYRHTLAATPRNDRPFSPRDLSVEVTPYSLTFHWRAPVADDHTPTAALRYAMYLRDSAGNYLIRPGAIGPLFLEGDSQGERLIPGLNGTLPTTFFQFIPPVGALRDGTYYWDVQSIDSAGRGSVFAGAQRFTVGYTNPYPAGEFEATLPYRDTSLDLGDFDTDGDLDVALAGNSASSQFPNADTTILSRNLGVAMAGTYSFLEFQTVPRVRQGTVRWGDMDGDGDLDLAISGESFGQPLTQIFENVSGVLQVRHLLTGVTQSALDWADFDNDGDLDLIVTGYRNNVPLTRLYRNDGAKFVEQATTLPDIGSGAVAWGDFDGDGDLDLLLCGDVQRYDAPVAPSTAPPYHQRPPNSYYAPFNATAPPPRPRTILLRNDGLNLSGRNAGQWQFTPVATDIPPLISSFRVAGGTAMSARLEWCDVNGDGSPDLVVGGLRGIAGHDGYARPTALVMRNAGPDTNVLGGWKFVPGNELLTDALPRSLQSLTCADWDNDGLPDVLMSGRINDVGNVPTQIIHNDNLSFTRRTYLRSTDSNASQFASGLAGFGHFTPSGSVDVLLSGMWGIRNGSASSPWGAVERLFINHPPVTNAPPSAPTGLSATVLGTTISFTWQPSGDDHTPASGLTYNLLVERTNGAPGGLPGMADTLTGDRRVCRVGNVGSHTSWTLHNLPPGQYRWAVQAIDSALLPSAFTSAAQTFAAAPIVPPTLTPSAPLSVWVQGNPAVASIDFLGLAAGRNARILAGRRGGLFLSASGGPFEYAESGVFTDLNDVIIGAEGATAVGDAGVIRTSSDGLIWRESPSGTNATLRAVVRGGNGWVAAGHDVILFSTDRLSWMAGVLPAGTIVRDLAWDFGRYVAVGEKAGSPVVLHSTDGLGWNDVTPSGLSPGALFGLASDGAKFVAVGGYAPYPGTVRTVLRSSDGLTWTFTQTPDLPPILNIVHAAEGWFAVIDYAVLRSADAQTWQEFSTGGFLPPRFTCLAADAGLLTAAGNAGNVFDSPLTSISLTRRSGNGSIAVYNDVEFLAANGNTIVAAPASGISYSSQDGGRTWRASSYSGSGITGVAYGNGRFVRTGDRIDTSTDGFNWTLARNTGTRAIAYGGNLFVAATTFDSFLTSVNSLTWSQTSPAFYGTVALAYGLGVFMALDFQGAIHTSANGAAWTQTALLNATRLSFAHDRFFALSSSGLVQSSVNGTNWQTVGGLPFGAVIRQVIWHRDRFIAVGGPNALLTSSPDGTNWTTAPVATSGTLTAALSVDSGLIVAGSAQALLLSPDPMAQPITTLPPSIGIGGQLTPNSYRLTVTGFAGQVITLELSEDLVTWTPVQTFTLSGGREDLEVRFQTTPPPTAFFRLQWSY